MPPLNLDSILANAKPPRKRSNETNLSKQDYAKILADFLVSGKRAIEISIDDPESPLNKRTRAAVFSGIRNLIKQNGLTDELAVATRQAAGGVRIFLVRKDLLPPLPTTSDNNGDE